MKSYYDYNNAVEMRPIMSKCVLGTVQLGMDYGIANKDGQPSKEESIEILSHAFNHSINTFDTAPGYGTSENILGEFLSRIAGPTYLYTKLQSLKEKRIEGHIRQSLQSSLKNLNQDKVEGLLIHNLNDFYQYENQFIKQLLELQSEGLTNSIGISIYENNDLKHVIDTNWANMVQIPFNIFDMRLQQSGMLDLLRENNIKVFARSVFLQGLFFMSPDQLPEKLLNAKVPLQQLSDIANSEKLSIEEIALLFVRDNDMIDHFLIGVENLDQLRKNIAILDKPHLSTTLLDELNSSFSNLPENLLDPRYW